MWNDNMFKITKHIATLSSSFLGQSTKELNLVKYKFLPEPILDIRKWDNSNGEKKILKGITLRDEEARRLKDALNEYYK